MEMLGAVRAEASAMIVGADFEEGSIIEGEDLITAEASTAEVASITQDQEEDSAEIVAVEVLEVIIRQEFVWSFL